MVGAANPVLVEVTRGGMVESRHRAAAVVIDSEGREVARWGDAERRILPRSAVKPLQAVAMVESGAAEAFALDDAEIALACASHTGERRHVATVAGWLARLGLDAGDLACGGHMPGSEAAARALIETGEAPSRLHDNCSGKHAGMLTLARHLEAPTKGYERLDHPVQVAIRAVLADLAGEDLADTDAVTDGCGVPCFALPLAGVARAFARFAAPRGLARPRAAACRRIAAAMAAEPEMVAGPGRFASQVIAATAGRVLIKGGAEGVFAAAWEAAGYGIAVKVDDGAGRAAEVLIGAVLDQLGAFDADTRVALAPLLGPAVETRSGVAVGEIRAALAGAGA